jgi:TPP-dependent pyruvate/acetoin dehydrogenase alpha subunit
MAATRKSAAASKRSRLAPERLRGAVRAAALIRAADERAAELSRSGLTGLVVPATGLEVLLAGTAAALRPDDWVLPGVRQAPVALARGLQPVSWFAQVLGRIADPARGRQEPGHPAVRGLNVFSVSTPVGSQLVHAAGVGRAMSAAGRGQAAVAMGGAATAATPDFHVGVNFAAVWRAPVVFVIDRGSDAGGQSATETVAEKAPAYGVPALSVDGADLAAVIGAVESGLSRARAGDGPTLVDVQCPDPPGLGGPTPSGPRLVEDEQRSWARRDPLAAALALVDDAEALAEEARLAAEEGAARALQLPPPPPELLFEDVFARRTPELDRQREEWRRGRPSRGAR